MQDAYYRAIRDNEACFKDKVVLDVGTGTGILAVWAAQAGARKVYAVEASKMARHARAMALKNGVEGVVEAPQNDPSRDNLSLRALVDPSVVDGR